MTEKINKKDFIEIEFTARIKDTGEVFDSNVKEELEKIGLQEKVKAEPFIFSVGQGMFLKGVDEFLQGKEIGKEHEIELTPDKAFGSRNLESIKIIPLSNFKGQQYQPVPGMQFEFDGQLGKVLSVSGGRVRVDFNHPVAGKEVIYKVKPTRKITDINEKIKNFSKFLFRTDLDFTIDEKNKKVKFRIPKSLQQLEQFIKAFDKKFQDLFELGTDIEEISEEEFKKILENNEKKNTQQK